MKSKKQMFKATMALGISLLSLSMLSSCKKSETAQAPEETPLSSLKKTNDITFGLIANWTFDGTANDVSGNGHNGSTSNVALTTDRFNNPNKAFLFNGSSSYVSVADDPAIRLSNTDFTMNAWIKLNGYNPSYGSHIISKRYSGINNGWAWSITGQASNPVGTVSYGPGGGSTNAYGSAVVDTTKWHMVTTVYTLSSKQLRIYIDGALNTVTDNIATTGAAVTAGLYIGRDNPSIASNGYFFNGKMDDVRIYNVALSPASVQELYGSNINAGLIAYWKFDGNGADATGNGNTATLNGVTSTTDRFGNTNQAFYFNGSSAFLSAADNAALRLSNRDFTLSAWVKMDAYNTSYGSQIINKRVSGVNNGWTWSVAGQASGVAGVLSFGPGGGNTNAFGTIPVSLNQWHLVTSVYSLANHQLTTYIDGVYDNVVSNIATPSDAVTATLYIGKDNPAASASGGYYFKGSMDDVRIYGRALSGAEVQQLRGSIN